MTWEERLRLINLKEKNMQSPFFIHTTPLYQIIYIYILKFNIHISALYCRISPSGILTHG